MKKNIIYLLLIFPFSSPGQIGIKAGLNFANVTKVSSINNSSQSGYNIGLFLSPPSKGIISSRTELLFSRQGYNYKTGTNTGNVNLNYLMLPQYMAINITRFFQLQFGGQMGFLLNASVDSSSNTSSGGDPYGSIMDYYNKFDFGYGGGVEIHPVSGLLVGARINISLTNLYSDYTSSSTPPSFVPKVDVKNNLLMIYAGWRFGKQSSSKKKEQSK